MLNYNTMMSAVLIKYWLSYKKLLAAVRVTIHTFVQIFSLSDGGGGRGGGNSSYWFVRVSSNIGKYYKFSIRIERKAEKKGGVGRGKGSGVT